MNEQTPQVCLCEGTTPVSVVEKTNELLKQGWQLAGPISQYEGRKSLVFYREMIKFPIQPQQVDMSQALTDRFNEKYSKLDERIKDLLEINGISLVCDGGRFFTSYKGEVTEGISPTNVLTLLKGSKHCPNNLDEEAFIAALDGLL